MTLGILLTNKQTTFYLITKAESITKYLIHRIPCSLKIPVWGNLRPSGHFVRKTSNFASKLPARNFLSLCQKQNKKRRIS